MTDRDLARIITNQFSDKEYYAYVDWAQSVGSEKVRAEIQRVKALVERGRI